MLWTDVLVNYRGGDVSVTYEDGLTIRGPLPVEDGMHFDQTKLRFTFRPTWLKMCINGTWGEEGPAAFIDFDTTLTRIRVPGSGEIHMDWNLWREKDNPKGGKLIPYIHKFATIYVYPPGPLTDAWHRLLEPTVGTKPLQLHGL